MALDNYITEKRRARIDEVLARRTRNLVLVLEGVHDPHNVAACLRSAEGLGLQEVHVVAAAEFKPHKKISKRSDQWLDVHFHETPQDAAAALKGRGYRLYAAALTPTAVPIDALDFTGRMALVLGNEHEGVSEELQALCDGAFVIPMRGFTQSFNVSVAAGITLYHAIRARADALGPGGDLDAADRESLRQQWVEVSIPRAALLKEELAEREAKGDPTGGSGSRG
ncbi:MAG: RNA methyltransferase [Pseudomonadota bacterium]